MDGTRAQLLANCKFLYGPDIEVITLRHGPDSGHEHEQAVVMRFDTFTASWTKFLHAEWKNLTGHAITALLHETEREVAKRFDMNGVGVPFDQNIVQHMTLHRREESISTTSSVTVDTPASSEADKDLVEEAMPVSEWKTAAEVLVKKDEEMPAAPPEAVPEPAVETIDEIDWGTSKKKKDKKLRFSFGDDILAEPEQPDCIIEPAKEVELWDFSSFTKTKKGKKNTGFTFGEPSTVEIPCEQTKDDTPPEPTDGPVEVFSLWGCSSKKKKGKKSTGFNFGEPIADENPIESKAEDIPVPPSGEPNSIGEPAKEYDPWASFLSLKSEMGNRAASPTGAVSNFPIQEPAIEVALEEQAAEEPSAPEEAMIDWCSWGMPPSKKSKKKKSNMAVDEECQPDEPAAQEEAIADVPALAEPETEPEPEVVDDYWGSGWPPSNMRMKKGKGVNFEEDCVSEPAAEEPCVEEPALEVEACVEEPAAEAEACVEEPCIEAPPSPPPELEPEVLDDGWGSFTSKKSKKKSVGIEEECPPAEPIPVIPFVEPPPSVEPESDRWGSLLSKKDKKGKKSIEVEEPSPPEPELGPVVKKGKKKGNKSPEPEPEPEVVSDGWGSFVSKSKKDKKKKDKTAIVGECPTPATEPEAAPAFGGWGTSWISNLEVDKKVVEEECREPEPEEVGEDFGWGSLGGKKNKKKKGKNAIVEEVIVEEECPQPEPEQVVEDFGWGSFSSKKDKKKKSKGKFVEELVIEEESPQPEPKPATEGFGWGSFTGKGDKKKKGKNAIVEEVIVEEPSPALAIEEVKGYVVDNPVLEDCKLAEEPVVEPAPAVEEPTTASPIVRDTSTTGVQTPVGYTVILKILHTTNTGGQQTLGTMVKLEDNTRKSILSAVNSYLDSITPRMEKRTLEITYGKGKDGDLKLSGLDEDMWPEYLNYFRSYWTFPEFTVQVVDE